MSENPTIPIPPPADQTSVMLPETGSARSSVGEHPVAPGSLDSAAEIEKATKQQEDMPSMSLVARTSVIEVIGNESKDIGFFRTILNYISNSSTKSLNQARLNLAAQDYLKDHLNEVDGILREIASNPSSKDPKIVCAFAGALKEIDLSKPEIQFTQSAYVLHSLAQKLPTDQITPDLIAFCNDFPEQAQALAGRQNLKRTSFRGINCNDGLLLMYGDKCYNPAILDLINPELFEGDDQDTRIKSFLANQTVTSNYFCKDGIDRYDFPHIILPNGVEILSIFGRNNSEYCKSTGKPFSRDEYLKYILGQFKEAYGSTDEAVKAFRVFVQNFTGSGNTLGGIVIKLVNGDGAASRKVDQENRFKLMCEILNNHRSQPTMRMDKGFNIDLNITACIPDKESIQKFNEINSFSFDKNTISGIAISSHIPAVINETMDQRGQQGKQTTTLGTIESFRR
ncbi:MAG: hypothetical protein LBD34_02260 [Puniceicoccales bacterium]|jgi:hypothetical protein|nr:hypothetical protein [Puniceicoccales bacterium]